MSIAEEQIDRLLLLTQKNIDELAASGVTNGNSHDHSGGDGAQIAHSTLSGLAPTWIEVSSFSNSWTNYGAPYYNAAYTKDAHGWVHLRGQIKDGTNDAKCFTLPTGYRPSSELNLTISANGPVAARLSIETDGDVKPASAGAVTGRIALDGVVFYVG